MKLMQVTCSGCGAELDVPMDVRFVRCRSCRALLELKRRSGGIVTEVRAPITGEASTETSEIDWDAPEFAADLVHYELERLERDWRLQREKLLVRSKRHLVEPSVANGIFGVVVGSVGGSTFIVLGLVAGQWIPLLAGVGFLIFATKAGFTEIEKARQFVEAERAYGRKRAELLRRALKQEHGR